MSAWRMAHGQGPGAFLSRKVERQAISGVQQTNSSQQGAQGAACVFGARLWLRPLWLTCCSLAGGGGSFLQLPLGPLSPCSHLIGLVHITRCLALQVVALERKGSFCRCMPRQGSAVLRYHSIKSHPDFWVQSSVNIIIIVYIIEVSVPLNITLKTPQGFHVQGCPRIQAIFFIFP